MLAFLKKYKLIFISVFIFFAIIIYSNFNPYEESFFPKCPFFVLTGYKCPGCGSQRVFHYLLNFEIVEAMTENLLVVVAIPYIILGVFFETQGHRNEKFAKIYDKLYAGIAIKIVFVAILAFWIGRNIF